MTTVHAGRNEAHELSTALWRRSVIQSRCRHAYGRPSTAPFAAVHLRCTQRVAALLPVDRCRTVLKAGGIGHVAQNVVRLQFESVRRAVREARGERFEECVQLLLTVGVAPSTQDAYGLIARPDRPAVGRRRCAGPPLLRRAQFRPTSRNRCGRSFQVDAFASSRRPEPMRLLTRCRDVEAPVGSRKDALDAADRDVLPRRSSH